MTKETAVDPKLFEMANYTTVIVPEVKEEHLEWLMSHAGIPGEFTWYTSPGEAMAKHPWSGFVKFDLIRIRNKGDALCFKLKFGI